MNIKEIWNEVLSILEVELTTYSYDAWIKTLEPINSVDGKLVLLAPSEGGRDFVNTRFRPIIVSALQSVENSLTDIIVIPPEKYEEYKNKEDSEIPVAQEKEAVPEPTLLNPKYNFENFVVGKCNQFVYAAAEAVAEEPGIRYNPFVIYGGVGLGKTHIMHAIGNSIKLSNPHLKILYVSSDKFVNEFIESIRTTKGKSTNFREKYRSIDVLMIDDIQFIGGKQATQEELFHTFNELYNANKQIVLSSDRPLKEITGLEERLRTRFEWGLTADILPPDLETRIAILQKKAQMQKYNISLEVLTYMAGCIDSNIREMEGLLNKVIFLSKLEEKTPTIELVKEAFKESDEKNEANITADDIIDATCRRLSVTRADLEGKKKNKEIVEPRQICIYLINELLDLPLASIGNIFGGRDHTTVMHARDKIAEKIQTTPRIKIAVQDIRDLIFKK